MKVSSAHVFFDGSGGSPRGSSCAAVMYDQDTREVLDERALLLPTGTNNVAEYSGLLLGLEIAVDAGVDELVVFSDSQLVVNQFSGKYDSKNAELSRLLEESWEVARAFDSVTLVWIPRERNAYADDMCRKIINENCPTPTQLKKQKKRANRKRARALRS